MEEEIRAAQGMTRKAGLSIPVRQCSTPWGTIWICASGERVFEGAERARLGRDRVSQSIEAREARVAVTRIPLSVSDAPSRFQSPRKKGAPKSLDPIFGKQWRGDVRAAHLSGEAMVTVERRERIG